MLKSKRQHIIGLFIFIFAIGIFIYPHGVFAAGLVPCGGPTEKPCDVIDVFIIIARTTNWLLRVAGIYAVYKIIQASFNLVISMGNEESLTKNKGQISNVVVGLAFVMFAYVIVNTVVNYIFLRGIGIPKTAPKEIQDSCKLNLASPLTYVTIESDKYYKCKEIYMGNKAQY